MNKHLMISLAVLSTVSMTALPALAEGRAHHGQGHHNMKNRDPGVNQRQHRQSDRIQQGVRSGELTRAEAHGLREDRRDIRAQEREYKADGQLTKDERRDLHQDMNALSKDIHTQKHDDDKRPRAQ